VDELDNGLRIRQIVRSDSPLLCAVLVLESGESSSPLGMEGLAALTGDSLQGGTTRRSGTDLAEELEKLGSSLSVSVGWDGTTVAFTVLAERADRMFDLMAEVVRTPAFPTDEVERVRRQRLATITQRKMEPDCLADDELDRRVFPASHPYHRPIGGSVESMGALGAEEVRGFALSHLGPGGGGVAIVGDVTPAEGRKLLDRTFGDWKGPATHLSPPPLVQEPVGPAVVIVDKPGAVQSELRIGHASPARSHPSEVPLKVANMVLGGALAAAGAAGAAGTAGWAGVASAGERASASGIASVITWVFTIGHQSGWRNPRLYRHGAQVPIGRPLALCHHRGPAL
jgi:zinc protease